LSCSGFCFRDRRLKLFGFGLVQGGIDLEQDCSGLYQNIGLDRYRRDRTGDIRRYFDHRPMTAIRPEGVRVFSSATKTASMKHPNSAVTIRHGLFQQKLETSFSMSPGSSFC
jgi:hypothetical protein